MKILFIGNVKFSEDALKKLIDLNENIVGVITKKESKFNSDFVDISCLAKEKNIPFKYVKNINEKENVEFIKTLNPDVIYCFGFSQIIKKEILSIPKLGVIGFHPANLPQNRGRHPIIWALFLGLRKTASTFFFMDEGADSGDILSQVEIEINYEDDANSLYNKITNVALQQIEFFTKELKNNSFKRIKQDETKANYWRKRGLKDGEIDFRMSSIAIYNLVRALTKPYIGAHIIYNKEEVKIWRVIEEEYNLENIEPGKIVEVKDNTILVKCYDKAVRIIEHEFKKLPKAGEYF